MKGVPGTLAIRSFGATAAKYYLAVSATDVLARPLEPVPGQSPLLVRGMWLEFDLFHMCDVEVDVVMVGIPTSKREITVCGYFDSQVFPTVSVGDDSIFII